MGVQQISTIVTSDYSDYISKRNKVTKSLVTNKTNQITKRNKAGYLSNLASSRAEYIARKLNNPSRIAFYRKCAWNLTDAYTDRLLAIALTKNNPIHYFSKAAANEMKMNGE